MAILWNEMYVICVSFSLRCAKFRSQEELPMRMTGKSIALVIALLAICCMLLASSGAMLLLHR